MIIDTLTAAAENELYPPVIRQALQAVLQQQPHALPPGKYTVESDNVFFTVVEGHTRPLSEQRPEYHRQYLDIHIVLKGEEIIGAGNKGLPVVEDGHFNTTQDIGFCQAIDSETLIHLYPEELAILFLANYTARWPASNKAQRCVKSWLKSIARYCNALVRPRTLPAGPGITISYPAHPWTSPGRG